MFCSQCGKEISEDSKFCFSCGSKIEIKENQDTVKENSPSIVNTETTPETQNTILETNDEKSNQPVSSPSPKTKIKMKNLGFGLLILLIVYSSIMSGWSKNDFYYSSNLTKIILIVCIPLLILSYILFKKFLFKINFFINKGKLLSFSSGVLSLIIVMSIIKFSLGIDKSNYIRKECVKQCNEFYKHQKLSRSSGSLTNIVGISCKNHFNKKLNTCLVLKESYNNHWSTKDKELRDTVSGHQYGLFSSGVNDSRPYCIVSEIKCNSEQEWDSLVKPYMEE